MGFGKRETVARIKGWKLNEQRKNKQVGYIDDGIHFICVETSACWHPSHCDRTQDTGPPQQCHCLVFHTPVCRNQKEKSKMLGGLFLEPGTGVWEHGWSTGLDLGERLVRAGGPAGARGPGSEIGSGATCFVM